MEIEFEHNRRHLKSDLSLGISIAIDLDFKGLQPNHFGAERAVRKPLELNGFVGRTALGGGCNVDEINLVPHCNGTHTETVGHIVDDDVNVGQATLTALTMALLISVEPVSAVNTNESYRPRLEDSDQVVTAESIESQIASAKGWGALIVRVLPNDDEKQFRAYTDTNRPAFLTVDAMEYVVKTGAKHLLIDLPSVDRMYDDGLLTNHHLFWNVAEQTHKLTGEVWKEKTLSEMIFVPNSLVDGEYLLSIQVPPFCSDAAPSRPIVYHVSEVHR